MPDNHVTKLVAVLTPAISADEIKIILTKGDPLPNHGFGNETVDCKIIGAIALRNTSADTNPTISAPLLASYAHHWNIIEIDGGSIGIPDHPVRLQKAFCCGLAQSISMSSYVPGTSTIQSRFDSFVIVEHQNELFAIRYCKGTNSEFEYRKIMDSDYVRHFLTADPRS